MEGRERRESRPDLEIGKQHLIELIELQNTILAKYDQEKHKQLLQVIEDLRKTEDALHIKKNAELAAKYGIPPFQLRAEDRELMRKTLEDINNALEEIES